MLSFQSTFCEISKGGILSSLVIIPRRFNSCTRFTPLSDKYSTLRHIHFDDIVPFEEGQQIQNSIVAANLDFKRLESKIRRRHQVLTSQGFGLVPAEEQLLRKVMDLKPFPTMLSFQFNKVYTGGKQMKLAPNLKNKIQSFHDLGCEYFQLERGGQVTWHGPGQLTAYVILDLKNFSNLTIRCFVDSVLLQLVRNVLKKYHGIETHLSAKHPGVWLDSTNEKIASVGCNIQRGITSYGIGLNINPDLSYMNSNEMCGLPDVKAISIEKATKKKASCQETSDQLAREVALLLNIKRVQKMNGDGMLNSKPT